MVTRVLLTIALVWVGMTSGPAGQALGTFRWQLQPFCNLVTLSVRQDGGVYTLDGSDDQCGAAEQTSVVGTAFLNPDGSIGMGLTSMAGPGAAPVILQARLDLATIGGAWSDSAGNSGAFVFTPGAGAGGEARPVPANGIRPASITSGQLAPGAVGAAQIAFGAITSAQLAPGAVGTAQLAAGAVTAAQLANGAVVAGKIAAGAVGTAQIANGAVGTAQLSPGAVQLPLAGACPVGQYLRGVSAGGAIVCEPFFVPNLITVADDPGESVGAETSIAIGADGFPVVSHVIVDGAFRVTKCGNAACSAGNVSTTVDAAQSVTDTAIAIGADGLPVIAYGINPGALRVTKCGNPSCTAGPVSTTVDGSPINARNVGGSPSIAIGADGLPIISHHDQTAGALRVTKCGNAFCTAGNVSTTIDDQANTVGLWSSMAIGGDGRPVISHQDSTAATVRVTKCGNVACTSGNVTTTVDDPANQVGLHTAIGVPADGLPIISYSDSVALALRVTKCGNPACSAGNVSTTVDDPEASVGSFGDLAIGADGRPIISHRDVSSGALRVTKCGNAACTAGNVSGTVDDPGSDVGWTTSIAIGTDGLPVISHLDGSVNNLRVVKCGTQSCR